MAVDMSILKALPILKPRTASHSHCGCRAKKADIYIRNLGKEREKTNNHLPVESYLVLCRKWTGIPEGRCCMFTRKDDETIAWGKQMISNIWLHLEVWAFLCLVYVVLHCAVFTYINSLSVFDQWAWSSHSGGCKWDHQKRRSKRKL